MRPAAIGVSVHSGWSVLVAAAGKPGCAEIIERRRVIIADPRIPGAKQPYHFAEQLGMPEAEKHLARCSSASLRLAGEAVGELLNQLRARNYEIAGAAILLSSGRPLPELARILSSHTLIHTAEGIFFREVFRQTFAEAKVPVTGIVERELDQRINDVLGKAAPGLQQSIAGFGRSLGPPWTKDHKNAALAAFLALRGNGTA